MKKIAFLYLTYAMITSITFQCYSQSKIENIFFCGYTANTKVIDLNTSLKEESFAENKNIENIVDKIVGLLGLSINFIIVSSPNINNAYAVTNNDGIRYIVYDPNFINVINTATTNWSTLSILAHEIGHHLSGHTLTRPKNLEEQRAREIEADEFSGFIMYKLGASIFQAQGAMNLVASNNDDTYSTHPSLIKRNLAIERGYEKAKAQDIFYKIDPAKSAEEYYNEAFSLVLANKFFDAIPILNKVIKLNPNYFKAYNDLGYCKSSLNDNFNAISNFNESIKINPNFDRSYVNRGVVKFELKDYRGAIEDYDVCLKINPMEAIAYCNRGYAKQFIGDYKGSIEDLDRAIDLQPNYAGAYLNRSSCYCLLKKFKKSMSDCEKAIKIDPAFKEAYFNRGSIKGQLADLSGMCSDFRISCNLGFDRACNAINQYCH